MSTLPTLLSLIYFASFTIYLFAAIYIFFLNKVSMKNITFLLICLSLSVWSFALSIASSVPDYGTAFAAHRVAALGWGTMFSFLLHFILILTEKNKLLQKKWIYFVMYVPALVNVVVFSINSKFSKGLHNLTLTALGWSVPVRYGFWDWFFKAYYVSFTILGICLVLHWKRKTTTTRNKKVANLFIVSTFIAFILGSITDMILNSYLSVPIPKIAPLIILLPIMAIFYSIKRYDFMRPTAKTHAAAEGIILSEASRSRVYVYISFSYLLGSLINFIAHYFLNRASIKPTLLFSMLLIFFALIILFINQLKIKGEHKDIIIVCLMSLSIPIISLNFIEYASITVWAAPAIILLLAVLFSNQHAIIFLGAAIISTQILVWIKVPAAMVPVNASDHLARIFLFLLLIYLSIYVNRVFTYRLKENEEQTRNQKLISQVSAEFVNVSVSNMEETIGNMLQRTGKHFGADWSYLFRFSQDNKTLLYAREWCEDGIKPLICSDSKMPASSFPWLMGKILNGEEVYIPDGDMLPPEARVEKELLNAQKVKSAFSIPVMNKGKILGFLGFGTEKGTKTWRHDHRELSKVLANILADALTKVAAEEEIKRMAFFDPLTDLPNRQYFKNKLIQEIDLSKRTGKIIGVVFIDLDNFKNVNDTMGHEGGDDLIKQVSRRLTGCIRKHDTVSRFGGDEFLAMFTNIARVEDISKVTEKIMKSFEQSIIVNGQEFFITASAGIAVYPVDGKEPEELIKNADMAMYTSKAQGKNKFLLCSPELKNDVLEKMKLTNSLYRAQERSEFTLHYQPQVNAITGKIVGLEALIRWQHPVLGLISPGAFVPLAEQTGLINPIGEWALKTACRQSVTWQASGLPPVRLAVNLSTEQLKNSNLVSVVCDILNETGLKPEYLELEITESIAAKQPVDIVHVLNQLKKLGVTITIDDFGSEYSSLSIFKMLPIDRIKIDMQFVQGILKNDKDEAIAKIIIQLARNLDYEVIAEGVETKEQLEFLKSQRCDVIQGYYYFKPMPKEEIESILARQLG